MRSKIASATGRSMSFLTAPAMNFSRCLAILALSFLPIAERRMSASESVNPASCRAASMTCSW